MTSVLCQKVSFIHSGNESMASFRYRVQQPASVNGWRINEPDADVLIFGKPIPTDRELFDRALADGRIVIADICDDHFARQPIYRHMALRANAVTCPTAVMHDMISCFSIDAHTIHDPWLYEESEPHCKAGRVLWFGHASNLHSLKRCLTENDIECELRILTNASGPGLLPWSEAAALEGMSWADMVILPATAAYKSPNRAVEAIRRGCFVVAEPHPSLAKFDGIWVGNIKEGIEWALNNQSAANEMTRRAQDYVRERYSPRIQASAWMRLVEDLTSTSDVVASDGLGGSASISNRAMSRPTSDDYPTLTDRLIALQPYTL